MEIWLFFILSFCVAALFKFLYDLVFPKLNLPPGPTPLATYAKLPRLRKSFLDFEPILRNLHAKYGSILTLQVGSSPAIFISSNSLAHHALVQNGAVFADRPEGLPTNQIFNSNQHTITSARYGSTWRFLRRNLTSEFLHPPRVRSYSHGRKWVLELLISRLQGNSEAGGAVQVIDNFRYAIFCLLLFMCFGEKFEEKQLREIENVQRRLLLHFGRFNILNLFPRVGKVLFRRKWEKLFELRKEQERIHLPYIRARQRLKQKMESKQEEDNHELGSSSSSKDHVQCYVDTLLDLQLPEEKRKLEEGEIVSLCSELLNGGTDTTSTALQWIMANLVKYPNIQAKLFEEIRGVVGEGKEEVKEEDVKKMPYLKAVILEGLRRHPPSHIVWPHSVTQVINFQGYVIPKNATVNFMVAEMGWNPTIWEDPMSFKPERFLKSKGNEDEVFDITGSREIKMMPFSAGRRMCPGHDLAMLHLEYFVANLVWRLEWKAVDGDEVDLSEKQEFTTVMKNPLLVHVSPRWK